MEWIEKINSLIYVHDEKTFLGKILSGLLILLIGFLLMKLIRKLLHRSVLKKIRDESKKADTLIRFIDNVFRFLITFWALTYVLEIFGINTKSIIATAGIGGIAIGFGAQSLVKDIITGIFILFEDQFKLGDYIIANGLEGYVIKMNLRSITLQAFNGDITHIPNGSINAVTNTSIGPMRARSEIPVPYVLDVDKVIEELEKALKSQEESFKDYINPPKISGVVRYTDFHYIIRIEGKTAPMSQWTAERNINYMGIKIINKLMRELENEKTLL